ncbi:MAG: hypothetical protein DRP87_01370 [Spirochaetes bacterium]|nr:MAG: hypothetical protein DRP87_01370 [Spirochaetota bacterium]
MKNERSLKILEIVSRADKPVGSWYIANKLSEVGIEVSFATIGRDLNSLEQKGFLKKNGIKGRTITPLGVEALLKSKKKQSIEEHNTKLVNLINSNVLKNFLMVLEARKTIEMTTARLAAQNITDNELKKLSDILTKQQKSYMLNKSAALEDIEFHRTIAIASRNEVLSSLYMFIATMGQQSELFEQLWRKLHKPYMGYHQSIYESLKEHSPEKAEKYMEAHLNQLCRDVENFWHEFNENKSISNDS